MQNQKKPDVCNFSARDSGAGNGLGQFYGHLAFLGLFVLENAHANKIPRFLGGGVGLGFLERGGGSANFIIFMVVGIFPTKG